MGSASAELDSEEETALNVKIFTGEILSLALESKDVDLVSATQPAAWTPSATVHLESANASPTSLVIIVTCVPPEHLA
jgi:hypothetical protein